MSEAAIRAQIKTILEGVPNIGIVHDYERWAVDWNVFINLFKTTVGGTDQIRGWEIGRRSAKENQVAIGGQGGNERRHSFIIRGYLGLNDSAATEKTFNDLIEAIAAVFRYNWTINDTALNHEWVQAEVIEIRMFGSVLCHYCELILPVCEEF